MLALLSNTGTPHQKAAPLARHESNGGGNTRIDGLGFLTRQVGNLGDLSSFFFFFFSFIVLSRPCLDVGVGWLTMEKDVQ